MGADTQNRLRRASEGAGGFFHGFALPFRALAFLLRQRGLKRYALLPLVVNTVLFVGLAVVAVGWALPALDLAAYSPAWLGWVGAWTLSILKWLLGLVLLALFLYFGFTTIGMVVASPFNDLLCEKTEAALAGRSLAAELDTKTWARVTLHSLWQSTKLAAVQLGLTLLVLPLLVILPPVGAAALFLVNAYYGGLGFLDIPMAIHFLGGPHRAAGLRDRRADVLGMGAAMAVLLWVPFLGLLVLPLGVVGAAMLYHEIDWERRWTDAGVAPPPGWQPPVGTA